MSDTLEIAKKCDAILIGEPNEYVSVKLNGHIVFTLEQLQSFREEIENLALAEAQERNKVMEDALREVRTMVNPMGLSVQLIDKALSTTSNV